MYYLSRVFLFVLAVSSLVFGQKSKVTSGSMAYNNGEFDQAIRYLDEALAKPELLENKDKAKAHFKKGQSLKGALMKQDANVLAKYPNAAFDALQAFRDAKTFDDIKLYEKELESEMLMMANIMYQAGVGLFQQAAKVALSNPDAYPVLMEQSIKYLKTADELQPNNMGILAILGSVYHFNKEDKMAMPVLEKAISLYESRKDTLKDKNMASTYMDLASVYTYEVKDFKKAMELLEKGKVEFPDVKDFEILELNFYMSGDNMELGIQKFEKAIAENPKSEDIHIAYAALLEKKGDLDAASRIYEKVLTFNPNSFNCNYNLAAMYVNKAVELKKQEESTEDYTKASEYGKEAEALFGKALPYMEKAHEIDSKDMPTISGLIQVYTQLNQLDKSKKFVDLRNQMQGK